MSTIAVCLVATLALSSAAPPWSSLSDQEGRLVQVPAPPFVVVVVGARRARDLRAWEERLRALSPRPEILRVVDVPEGGRPADVARKLRQRAPAGVSIAVDVDRAVARALELDMRDPQVLVLDAEGRIANRIKGRASDKTAAAAGAAWAAVSPR
jgi:hypothetical protein